MAIDEMKGAGSFPRHEGALKAAVIQHSLMTAEPLCYAAYVELERDKEHVFLFEIVENFGRNEADPDRRLWEVGFVEFGDVQLPPNGEVRLILTNPTEFRLATQEDWHGIRELRRAFKTGRWIRLFGDEQWERML